MTGFGGRPTIRFPSATAALRRPARAFRDGRSPEVIIHDRRSAAVLEGLKARLDQLLRDASPSDRRAYLAGVTEALLEARLGITRMREALAATERELASERKQLEDAERRGRLAAQIPDPETVSLAQRYAVKHRDRVSVLERKLPVQQDELALAERELAEMTAEVKAGPDRSAADSVAAAWRDLEAAGAVRPDEQARTDAEADRARREQAVEAQLAYLKKKMGKA